MTLTFTPPSILAVPPISVADRATAPPSSVTNPAGTNLMKYFPSRARAVNVWKMKDGTYQMSDPVPGVTFTGTIAWPYPDTLDPVNDAIVSSWFPGGPGGVGGSGPGGLIQHVTPGIAVEYLGGHSYTISTTEAAALAAVGLGVFIT